MTNRLWKPTGRACLHVWPFSFLAPGSSLLASWGIGSYCRKYWGSGTQFSRRKTGLFPFRQHSMIPFWASHARKGRVMLAEFKSILVVGSVLLFAGGCATHAVRRPASPDRKTTGATSNAHVPRGVSSLQPGWVVVVASSQALWWNGRRFGLLCGGRFCPLVSSGGSRSQLSRSALTRLFRKCLQTVPLASWRLRLVVSDRVSSVVVQRLLGAAGSAGFGRFRLVTFHEP